METMEIRDALKLAMEALRREADRIENTPELKAVNQAWRHDKAIDTINDILDQRGCEDIMVGEHFEDGRLTSLMSMVIYG